MAEAYYPEGTYACSITEQGLGESAEKGTPFLFVRFCVEGRAAGTDKMTVFPEGIQKYERTAFFYITEKTIDFLTEDLAVLGFTGTSFRELDPRNPSHQSFVGEWAQFRCKHEAYEGKTSEKWSLNRAGGGMEVKPLDSAKARQLDALFGRNLQAAARQYGQAPPPAATQTADAVDEVF